MAELDTQLVAALKAAKSKRMYFALVLKGSKDGALMLSKTRVPPAKIAEAKKESGGSKVLRGFCQVEDGVYVFETSKEAPPTAAQAVKLIVKRDAGLAVRAEFRVNADPELLDEETDSSDQTVPEAPPVPSSDGASVMKRLSAISAEIKTALAGPNKARVQALVVEIGNQIKSKAFDQAAQGLDELEPLVSQATGPAKKEPAAKSNQPDGMPADAALETAANTWEQARLQSLADLDKLAAYIREDFQDEPDAPEVSATVDNIRALFDDFDDRVRSKLKEIVSAPRGEPRRPLYQQAEIMLRAYRAQLNSPLIKNLDSNPFMPVKIHGPMYAAVAELAALVHV